MARMFALMGMSPVSYYDLSTSGLPVHATAFRPTTQNSLDINPFRVFTSLLRPELIADASIRELAESLLSKRSIFTDTCLAIIDKADRQNGRLSKADAETFVKEALITFQWHSRSRVTKDQYHKLSSAHKLAADVCSFQSCHINHLTPRTLDIEAVQRGMSERGIPPKAIIEGPPPSHPILLRQTSFLALSESIEFLDPATGQYVPGHHQARFGEIEQRSLALTLEGRELYQELLARAQTGQPPELFGSPSHSNTMDLNLKNEEHLERVFSSAFPGTYEQIRQRGLGYFRYSVAENTLSQLGPLDSRDHHTVDNLLRDGYLTYEPLIYEDFLPASAAGIFQSNIGAADGRLPTLLASGPDKTAFEEALGRQVVDEMVLYERSQQETLDQAALQLGLSPGALTV